MTAADEEIAIDEASPVEQQTSNKSNDGRLVDDDDNFLSF